VGRSPPSQSSQPSPAEAYRTLGLDPGTDEAAVRAAYRQRVKEVHPDRPSGDEDEFKRVTRAYERLTDRST
jgi:curved DNA-binding protein CbpA